MMWPGNMLLKQIFEPSLSVFTKFIISFFKHVFPGLENNDVDTDAAIRHIEMTDDMVPVGMMGQTEPVEQRPGMLYCNGIL